MVERVIRLYTSSFSKQRADHCNSGILLNNVFTPPEDITFSGRVTVKNLVLRGVLHGVKDTIDVIARLTDAVRLQDTAITITGKKIFTAGLSFGNLHVEILNGRKLDHFLALVVTRNRPHTLTGSVRVRGTIIAPWVTAQQLTVQVIYDLVYYLQIGGR